MDCPYKDEDMPNEKFSQYDHDCQRCRYFKECENKYMNEPIGDNHPIFSASTRNKLQNKYPEFYDKKRFEKGKILQEDIINFAFNLLASEPKEIWYELSHLKGVR